MQSSTQPNLRAIRPRSVAVCAVALTLGALLFSGCSSNQFAKEIVGSWKIDLTQGSNAQIYKSSPIDASFASVKALVFTSDGKYNKTSFSGHDNGTYELNGADVTLHPQNPDRGFFFHVDTELHGTLSSDGKTLTMIDNKDTFVYVKSNEK